MKKVRYFMLKQFTEPMSMFTGNRLVDISDLEKIAEEITEEQAKQVPHFAGGNISVDDSGAWNWVKTNHDTSD